MGPQRAATSRAHRNLGPTTGETHKDAARNRRKFSMEDDLATELPGVQKLKAALRQTRRLLAKDNLAADVRVETERRLKSIESDLQAAELIRKERIIAKRYHKVKFFERRKVLRKMKKVKRELGQSKAASSKGTAHQLENALYELRVQLNYIQNYPKLEKYISLFPPSAEKCERNPDLGDTKQTSKSETDARREQLLREVEARMAAGELSGEPEVEVETAADAVANPYIGGKRPGEKGGTSNSLSGTKEKLQTPPYPRKQRTKGIGHRKAGHMEDEFFEALSVSSSDSPDSDSAIRADVDNGPS